MSYFGRIRNDFLVDVAAGLIDGHSIMRKFGQNSDIGTAAYEDIWDGGGTYVYPADGTAPISHIISNDIADTEILNIQGLDIDGVLTTQNATLNGTTAVALTTPLWRVFRMMNMGSNDLVGTEVCATNSGDTQDYACIDNGNNQTLMALYTIPSGHTGYLMRGTVNLVGLTNDYNIDVRMAMRPHGGVFQLKQTMGLNSGGSSYVDNNFDLPGKIPALTDIRVSAISSKNGGIMNATFEVLLIED